MKTKPNRGFIEIIILAIIVIATLAYFNIDVRGIVQNAGVQKVLAIFIGAWNNYLVPMWHFIWTGVTNIFPAR